MNEIRLRVTRENSTVDGYKPGVNAEWDDLDFDEAWLDGSQYRYMHAPHVNGETVHRVRFRWYDSKVRIGGTDLGRVAWVRLEKEPDGNAWCWVVGLEL